MLVHAPYLRELELCAAWNGKVRDIPSQQRVAVASRISNRNYEVSSICSLYFVLGTQIMPRILCKVIEAQIEFASDAWFPGWRLAGKLECHMQWKSERREALEVLRNGRQPPGTEL